MHFWVKHRFSKILEWWLDRSTNIWFMFQWCLKWTDEQRVTLNWTLQVVHIQNFTSWPTSHMVRCHASQSYFKLKFRVQVFSVLTIWHYLEKNYKTCMLFFTISIFNTVLLSLQWQKHLEYGLWLLNTYSHGRQKGQLCKRFTCIL